VSKFAAVAPDGFLTEYYLDILKESKEALCAVIETMVSAQDGGVLFHCAAGKDRTGIIAVLLFGLVGVSVPDILSNYEISYTLIRENPDLPAQRESEPIEHWYSGRESLEPALEYIHSFGGISNYLEYIGVLPESLKQVRKRLLA